jgi:hypothetical protein
MIKRKKIKKEKIENPIDAEEIIQIEESDIEQSIEKDWKESFRSSLKEPPKNKFCKFCIKKEKCVITKLACVMYCDKIEIKTKRAERK